MKTSLSLKPLTLEAVWNVAEKLIFKHGSTTTAEVKRLLRREQYYARQSEVASALEYLAEEDNWAFEWHGSYWSYSFTEDTDECVHFYLERSGQFWEIGLVEKRLYCSQGRVGQLGEHAMKDCASNRYGFYLIRQMIKEKEEEGFEYLEDVRPSWTTRLSYWHLLNEQPRQLQLYYRVAEVGDCSFCLRPQREDCVSLLNQQEIDPLALTGQSELLGQRLFEQKDLKSAKLLYDNGYTLELCKDDFEQELDFLGRIRLLVS